MPRSPDSAPTSQPSAVYAHDARELLAGALRILQANASLASLVGDAVEQAAAASNALYVVENEAQTSQAESGGFRLAVDHLSKTLSALQRCDSPSPELLSATESVARTLALLYPVVRAHQRTRRAVMLDASDPEMPSYGADGLPVAPEPGRPRRESPVYEGPEHRNSGTPRVFVEADIGLSSDNQFYTGLSEDITTGGLFVATYQPKAPGTHIALFFALPDGHVVQAKGIVRWTRDPSDDAPPGMGIAFEELRPEDRQAIERFCATRAPMYHDSAD